jgi:hypothetical protein
VCLIRKPGLLGFPLLLGPVPGYGFVTPEFVSDRGQHALPQVIRNVWPLKPDRRSG